MTSRRRLSKSALHRRRSLRLETLEHRRVMAAGMLDCTFDGDGLVTAPLGVTSVAASAVAMQSDGRIVAVGRQSSAAGANFAVMRFTTSGALDASFSDDGVLATDFDGGLDIAYDVAVQNDGKIVVAGSTHNSTTLNDFAVARYNLDGTLDTSFSGDGKLTLDLGRDERAHSLVIQDDGKIVLGGFATVPGGASEFALVRLTSDGALDATFADDGVATASLGASLAEVKSLALQADGKIVAAGLANNGSNFDFAVARFHTDGSLDTTFNGTGKVITPLGALDDIAESVAIAGNGKIVVAGRRLNAGSGNDFALVRYHANGSLDNTFDEDGKVTTAVSPANDAAYAVALQSNGQIVVAGVSSNGEDDDFALLRYNANGALDATFGTEGIVLTPFSASNDGAAAVAIQSDGQIVVAGATLNGNKQEFALARYEGQPSTSPSFSLSQATVALPESTNTASGVTLATITISDPDGVGINEILLTGPDADWFQVVGSSSTRQLRLKAGTSLDFETRTTYAVTVIANDRAVGGPVDDSASFTLNITNINDVAPTLSLSQSMRSLPENFDTAATTFLATITIQDGDANELGNNQLELTGTDAASFRIANNGGTRELHLKAGIAIDFEQKTSYSVSVIVNDPAVGGGFDDSESFMLTLSDLNDNVPVVVPVPAQSISEVSTGVIVDLDATDGDATPAALTWAIVGGNPNLDGDNDFAFSLQPGTGVLRVNDRADLNREAGGAGTITLLVTVNDGVNTSAPRSITIQVADVNDVPPSVRLGKETTTLLENRSTTAVSLAAIIVTEGDVTGLGTNELTLAGPDAALFEIATPQGSPVLRLRAGVPLNFEAKSSYSVRVNVNDAALGGPVDGFASFVLNVADVNEAPLLSVGDTASYRENAVPRLLAPFALLSDPDSTDFEDGVLTVAIVARAQATDLLGIRHQGTAAGQIGVIGTDITFSGQAIGTFSGGAGSTPLRITLQAGASVAATRALTRNITFASSSENPSTSDRSVRFTLSDGDGATSTPVFKFVTVARVNDRPIITNFGGAITYRENGSALPITGAAIGDVDSPNLAAGTLTVRFSAGGKPEDTLTIRSLGNVTVSGNNVLFGGQVIGSFTGGQQAAPLVISFNANATPGIAGAILRNVVYLNDSERPAASPRTLWAQVQDGAGGTSLAVTKTLLISPVNDNPVLDGIAGSVGYTINGPAVLLAATATVADVDNVNFSGGRLLVSVTSGSDAGNRLEIGGSVFTLQGTNIVRSGSVIGTLDSDGVGENPFEVTFTSNATAGVVQQLLRSLRFKTIDSTSLAARDISFVLSDGSGGVSNTLVKTVNVS